MNKSTSELKVKDYPISTAWSRGECFLVRLSPLKWQARIRLELLLGSWLVGGWVGGYGDVIFLFFTIHFPLIFIFKTHF